MGLHNIPDCDDKAVLRMHVMCPLVAGRISNALFSDAASLRRIAEGSHYTDTVQSVVGMSLLTFATFFQISTDLRLTLGLKYYNNGTYMHDL